MINISISQARKLRLREVRKTRDQDPEIGECKSRSADPRIPVSFHCTAGGLEDTRTRVGFLLSSSPLTASMPRCFSGSADPSQNGGRTPSNAGLGLEFSGSAQTQPLLDTGMAQVLDLL